VSYEELACEVKDGVAQLTLRRPEKLNALTPQLQSELRDALAGLAAAGEARCLVISGEGRGFCSGADLGQGDDEVDEQGEVDLGASLERHFNPTIRALSAQPLPTVAAVRGPCVGAGMSLALACDFVVAARSAYFSQAFVNVGLVPDAGSTWFLPRLVGPARATALMMLGSRLAASEAEQWGLVWRCVEDETLAEAALELATELASKPTRTLLMCRQALRASATNDLDRQLDLERDLQRLAGRTEDAREGLRAFAERRPPRFTGS